MTTINPDEITSIIKEKLQNYENKLEVKNIGVVLEVSDGISRIYGLSDAMSSELVEFEDGKGTLGIVLNLEEDNVGVVILGDYTHIKEGMTVKGIARETEKSKNGIFIELKPNLVGLAEYKDNIEYGQKVNVYIKRIIPEKKKVKLVIINSKKPQN